MAKWNWGGEENQGVGRIAVGDRAGGASPLSPQAVSTEGAHPLRFPTTFGCLWTVAKVIAVIIAYQVYDHFAGDLVQHLILDLKWDPYDVVRNRGGIDLIFLTFGMWLALRDSDGPRMAETNEDSAPGVAGPARAVRHRPENPAYFWLGIQAEGRE